MVCILILGILGKILAASCLQLNMDDVRFISAVYEHFKFDSGLVVVDEIAAIEYQARQALLKSDGNKKGFFDVKIQPLL